MRLLHIDVARGLCILLVALGHNTTLSPEGSAFNHILGLFRMPMMFFIAGTFFVSRVPFGELAWHKADALIKPFMVMALIQAPLRIAFWDVDPVTYGLGALSASGSYLIWLCPLWFLPHLWLVFLFAWGVIRLSERLSLKTPEMIMLMGTLLMLGVQILPLFWQVPVQVMGQTFTLQGLPFSADLLPISSFFFLIGVLARRSFHEMQFRWPALLLSIAVLVWTILLYSPTISLFGRNYTHIFAGTVAALAGTAIVAQLAALLVRVPKVARWVAFCGVNSLFILLFHAPVQNTVIKTAAKLTGQTSLLAGVLAYGACIMASLVAARLIRRHVWLGVLFLPIKQVRKEQAEHMARRRAKDEATGEMEQLDLQLDQPVMARRA